MHIWNTIINKSLYITESHSVWSANNSLVGDRSTVTGPSWSCDSTQNTALESPKHLCLHPSSSASVPILWKLKIHRRCQKALVVYNNMHVFGSSAICELVFRSVLSYRRWYSCTKPLHELVYNKQHTACSWPERNELAHTKIVNLRLIKTWSFVLMDRCYSTNVGTINNNNSENN
jgi:hypothetical protein